MNLKKIIPLTFSAVSLVSIPSVVCSCGNQYQPDYTIRCDTKEITWSLSQTTKTEEVLLYTKDKIKDRSIRITGDFKGHLAYYSDKIFTGATMFAYLNAGNDTLFFNNLNPSHTPKDKYWLVVSGFYYEDINHLQELWFTLNIIE